MKLNFYNFWRWTDSAPSTDQPDIPWAYWRDKERCFLPLAYPSEALAFYINTRGDVGLNYASFSDLRLAVIDASTGAVVNSNAGTLEQHFLDSPTNTIYNIHCTMVVPAIPDGVYKFRIYRQTGTVTLCESNYFKVSNNKARLDITSALFKFRHDRYFYGVDYSDLPDFYQIIRLPCSITDRQVEGEKEVYKEVTTGKQRTFNNELSRFIKLEMYYLSQEAHEAASLMFDHDFLEINGNRYRPKIAYKELTNPLSKLTKSEVELWDDAFASANRC